MKVRMTSHSTPDNIIGVDDAQELIAYCARVSNPGNQNNKITSEKLIKYLIKHKHWSPLEQSKQPDFHNLSAVADVCLHPAPSLR